MKTEKPKMMRSLGCTHLSVSQTGHRPNKATSATGVQIGATSDTVLEDGKITGLV